MRLGHHFLGQKVKRQLAGAGAYCGGLPQSFDHMLTGKRVEAAASAQQYLLMFYISFIT